jgi:hypothetical protein
MNTTVPINPNFALYLQPIAPNTTKTPKLENLTRNMNWVKLKTDVYGVEDGAGDGYGKVELIYGGTISG